MTVLHQNNAEDICGSVVRKSHLTQAGDSVQLLYVPTVQHDNVKIQLPPRQQLSTVPAEFHSIWNLLILYWKNLVNPALVLKTFPRHTLTQTEPYPNLEETLNLMLRTRQP